MPFKMALLAKTRRKMVEEIKVNTKDERYPVNEIIETVRGYSPREQQKFLDERISYINLLMILVEVIEKKKKKREYLNRDPVSNAYYNLCTLDKNAKERAIHKLELVLPFNCRYFK